MNLPTGYTISFWTILYSQLGYLISNGGHSADNAYHGISIRITAIGRLWLTLKHPDGRFWSCGSPDGAPQMEHWVHVTATWSEQDGASLFLDGTKVCSDQNPVPGTIAGNDGEFHIGVKVPEMNKYCHCIIDDIRTWAQQLSDEEIFELYESGK